MESLSKYNKENKYLLCAIDLFSKYAWVIPIKDKKGTRFDVGECTESVEEVKLAKETLAKNKSSYKCSSCAVYTALFWIFFTINVGGTGAYFVYFHGYLKKMFTRETTIYQTYKIGEFKEIKIKNRTYYSYNNIIDLKNFDARFLKINKKDYKEIDIYYIAYVTFKKIANCKNINSVNLFYLMINEMIGHFEERNENKYLVLDDVDENKEVSIKYEEVQEGVKKEIQTINGGKTAEYGKDFLKNTFKSNDDLPMNRPIKLRLLTINIRSAFIADGKFYPQLFLIVLCMSQYKKATVPNN